MVLNRPTGLTFDLSAQFANLVAQYFPSMPAQPRSPVKVRLLRLQTPGLDLVRVVDVDRRPHLPRSEEVVKRVVGGRDLVLEADGSRVRGIRRDGVGPQDDRFGPFTELARGTVLGNDGKSSYKGHQKPRRMGTRPVRRNTPIACAGAARLDGRDQGKALGRKASCRPSCRRWTPTLLEQRL